VADPRGRGPIDRTDNTWSGVDACLKGGHRGLNPGSSLAKLLLARRKRRHKGLLPRLTPARIVAWADAHHRRTGAWPIYYSGRIPEAPEETWTAMDRALRVGLRGLPGNSSLARLLEERRGVRNNAAVPQLTTAQVLAWADAYHTRTGRWPTRSSGPIPDAPGETWGAVAQAFIVGARGLAGPSSLARFLAAHRGVRNKKDIPRLTPKQILAWADAHHARTGRWPTRISGPIAEAPGEAWSAVEAALVVGVRGLPGSDSLARFLTRHRGVRNKQALPPLSITRIRRWVIAHYRRSGRWPRRDSGAIPEAPGETWSGVNAALSKGVRGLPGGSSLPRVVGECQEAPGILRGGRNGSP
jgi:hypothetical protein